MTTRANTTHCLFCNKEVSWPCINKHIFGVKHLEELVAPRLLKEGGHRLTRWRTMTVENCTTINLEMGGKTVFMCFGCKTAKQYLPKDHMSTCNAAEHIAVVKRLLGEGDGTSVVPDMVPANNEVVANLQSQIADLQSQVDENDVNLYKQYTFIKGILGTNQTKFEYEYCEHANEFPESLPTYIELLAFWRQQRNKDKDADKQYWPEIRWTEHMRAQALTVPSQGPPGTA